MSIKTVMRLKKRMESEEKVSEKLKLQYLDVNEILPNIDKVKESFKREKHPIFSSIIDWLIEAKNK